MILILEADLGEQSPIFQQLLTHLRGFSGIHFRVHQEQGAEQVLSEIYLIGNTKPLRIEDMEALPGVERAIRVSREYRLLGRHTGDQRTHGFDYNGVRFGQDNLNVFAGLCAVDTPEHV